jgi:DNA repair protein RadC
MKPNKNISTNTRKQILKGVTQDHIGSGISIQYKPAILHKEPMILALDVYEWVRLRWNEELINLQEQSMALFFNNASQLISYRLISTGNSRGTVIDVQLVVCLALHTMASKVILVHNHPSGKLEASKQDIKITQQVKAALQLIDVFLLDHLIITENCYMSIRGYKLV